jgi:hypothetical protein
MSNSDFDIYVLVSSATLQDAEVVTVTGKDGEQEAFWKKDNKSEAGKEVIVKASELSEQISSLAGTLKASLDRLEETGESSKVDGAGRLRLDSLKVGLSVNASGKVMLVVHEQK